MPVNFPNSPTIGDVFVTNGKTYQWDGEKWTTDTTVTKTDIGLENVQNYSVATQAEAEAGTLDNLYMTPLKTKQHVDERIREYSVTINTGDWSGTDPVQATVNVTGLLATDNPIVDLDLSSVAFADVETTQTEYAKIYQGTTSAGSVTFDALETPTENLTLTLKVVE